MAIGPHTRGQRGIRTEYPVTSGTTAETTKTSDRVINLVASKPYQILNLRIVDGKVFYRPEILNSNLSNEYFDSIVSKPAETSVLKNITDTGESLINSLNFLKLKPNK